MNDGGPAFPNTDSQTIHRAGMLASEGIADPHVRDIAYLKATHECARGMTLRDWFAGQVLAGMMASISSDERCAAVSGAAAYHDIGTRPYIALESYALADAMLAEREKGV